MNSLPPSSLEVSESSVDTVLTLPDRVRVVAIAEACRATALEFLNDCRHWGKAELATWLMGPYAQLTQYVAPTAQRKGGEVIGRPVPLLRDIDVRMVDRVIRTAYEEVTRTLRSLESDEDAATFAYAMISSGFVARCEDKTKTPGWVPTSNARRLADRVLSLFAVDYLTSPSDYESSFSLCPTCKHIEFDALARRRGVCSRHADTAAHSQRFGSMPPPSQPLMA